MSVVLAREGTGKLHRHLHRAQRGDQRIHVLAGQPEQRAGHVRGHEGLVPALQIALGADGEQLLVKRSPIGGLLAQPHIDRGPRCRVLRHLLQFFQRDVGEARHFRIGHEAALLRHHGDGRAHVLARGRQIEARERGPHVARPARVDAPVRRGLAHQGMDLRRIQLRRGWRGLWAAGREPKGKRDSTRHRGGTWHPGAERSEAWHGRGFHGSARSGLALNASAVRPTDARPARMSPTATGHRGVTSRFRPSPADARPARGEPRPAPHAAARR